MRWKYARQWTNTWGNNKNQQEKHAHTLRKWAAATTKVKQNTTKHVEQMGKRRIQHKNNALCNEANAILFLNRSIFMWLSFNLNIEHQSTITSTKKSFILAMEDIFFRCCWKKCKQNHTVFVCFYLAVISNEILTLFSPLDIYMHVQI